MAPFSGAALSPDYDAKLINAMPAVVIKSAPVKNPRKAQPFAVDKHPMRQRIIDDILKGVNDRVIAKNVKPPISHMSIWAYKSKVVKPALANASIAAKVLHKHELVGNDLIPTPQSETAMSLTEAALKADIYVSRAEEMWLEALDTITKAKKSDRLELIASLIGRGHDSIRLTAELTGRLQKDAAPSVNIRIGLPEGPEAPSITVSAGRQQLTAPAIDVTQPDELAPGAVIVDVRR